MTTRLLVAASLCLAFTPGVTADEDEDGWVSMFDGESLEGWKASEAKESFRVEDGAIVSQGQPRSHLYYVADEKPFVNFEFKAQVLTKPKSKGLQAALRDLASSVKKRTGLNCVFESDSKIIVTHEDEIAQHCQRVVEMKDGKIFNDSTTRSAKVTG